MAVPAGLTLGEDVDTWFETFIGTGVEFGGYWLCWSASERNKKKEQRTFGFSIICTAPQFEKAR
jgi:hypothetical protein